MSVRVTFTPTVSSECGDDGELPSGYCADPGSGIGAAGRRQECYVSACGLPNRMERIVGGWPTRINEYPWVVALSIRGQFYCGGTIINDLYILTAAHCVSNKKMSDLTVVVSEHNKATMAESTVEVRKVARILVHEGFNQGVKYNNDIALLKLDRRLEFRVAVAPICLPYPDEQFSQALGRVTGWGHTKEGGPSSMELRETHVAVMSNSACHLRAGYGPTKVTANMMCAGLMEGGRDTCQPIQSNMALLYKASSPSSSLLYTL
ncbi:hypothetical protein J6590_059428 [Homalodisca vitripennis]|nr:hypothetical protein J6590_092669 [Homalodisca vitripennis]KAG8320868.1 hypothetical protein J6590_059428 [Homalodisca vitripennis]